MKLAFASLGVDYEQWKALTRAVLTMDFRVTRVAQPGHRAQQNRAMSMVALGITYVMMGGFASMLVLASDDVMLSGTLILSYVMFMVGAMVLMDHGSVITSPADYAVLGARPVGSRTYFAVRLTNVLVYTTALTTLFGGLPMIVFGIARGPLVGAAAIAAFYLSCLFTTLLLITGYASILRLVGADRLNRVLSYVQLVMGFVSYGGYFAMSRLIDRKAIAAMRLPDSPLLLLYPPTWFASYMALAAGRADARVLGPIAASLAVIAAAGAVLGGRLSYDYTERLGALASSSTRRTPARSGGRAWWFRRGEARAIALLVRAQFRNDQKFRMAVLGLVPMTILYIVMSLRDGPLPDPFTLTWERAGNVMLVTLAVLVFPVLLRVSLSQSDGFRASWIFFATPSTRVDLLRATTSVLTAYFLVPYLALVAAVMGYFTRSPVHVIVHVVVLGLISHLIMRTVTLLNPTLPFSRPPDKTARSGLTFVVVSGAFAFGFVLGPLLASFVYVEYWRIAALAVAMLAATTMVDRLVRLRTERLTADLEFQA